jgi:hypothetical protein
LACFCQDSGRLDPHREVVASSRSRLLAPYLGLDDCRNSCRQRASEDSDIEDAHVAFLLVLEGHAFADSLPLT